MGMNIKKLLAVGIILLFIGIAYAPSVIANNPILTKTIYVDDDNTMGPWDGSQEHPYQFIQDGVDNASSGDTIIVSSGIYDERVQIQKSINLIGVDKYFTNITNGMQIKNITWVNISNFTLTNNGWSGVTIDSAENVTLYDNIIWGNASFGYPSKGKVGVHLQKADHTLIEKNIIRNCWFIGILIDSYSENNIIVDNLIDGVTYKDGLTGIQIGSSKNIVINNTLKNGHVGIYLTLGGSSLLTHNIITRNNITNNRFGLYLETTASTISENNFIGNDENARVIQFYSLSCTIRNNYWDDWTGNGPKIITGHSEYWIFQFFYITIPFCMFDWHPAKEPFDIPAGGA